MLKWTCNTLAPREPILTFTSNPVIEFTSNKSNTQLILKSDIFWHNFQIISTPVSTMGSQQPLLLFFDTFSHEVVEELNLDLVSEIAS